jgi:hypothetical protein
MAQTGFGTIRSRFARGKTRSMTAEEPVSSSVRRLVKTAGSVVDATCLAFLPRRHHRHHYSEDRRCATSRDRRKRVTVRLLDESDQRTHDADPETAP